MTVFEAVVTKTDMELTFRATGSYLKYATTHTFA